MESPTTLEIRKFKPSDKKLFIEFVEESQDYMASIDNMKRTRRMADYGADYTHRILETVRKSQGAVYIAERQGEVIGLIAGIIAQQSKEELLECAPSKDGVVLELFVDTKNRRQKVGTALMLKMEEYFRKKGCNASRLEVFEPNAKAHKLYCKLRYVDRVIFMTKKL